ncbi:MAG: rhodanese-like domain-containing protein [Gammaproteobacteria bacterium]|nr:MAG: rhodanese-like domain-containing protein [Gammaproteobacteria bacterium]RTZ73987.1 MAG: rhodanese-like domain-containing protein [Gammaproteobacteria bacterium]
MEQLTEFVTNHLLLVLTFVGLAGALIWNVFFDPVNKNAVTPLQSTALINHEDAVVVDVRSIAEFNKGHIVNAINIPLNGLGKQLQQLEKYKERPIIIACKSGSRSGMAAKMLMKKGFEKVHNLRGGMMAWTSAGLPVKSNG